MNPCDPYSVALVISRFNQPLTEALYQGARACWQAHFDCPDLEPLHVWVPGAVEIPLMAQHLIRRPSVRALVCLGVVIQGDTRHFDYVCSQVSDGCQRVALDAHKPVVFGVLTTDTAEQAWDRVGGACGHKGVEAMETAIEMMALMQRESQNDDVLPPAF